MRLLKPHYIKRYPLILLGGFCIAATTSSLNAANITVKTYVDKQTTKRIFVYAVGFSVNKKGHGSLGKSTTKKGPAGATYSFGFRSGSGNISCGKHILMKNSAVVMSYNGKTCTSKVYDKKKATPPNTTTS